MRENLLECKNIAKNMRKDIIKMSDYCGGDAHWGGALSCVDILAVLYSKILNCKDMTLTKERKDKFLLSKGQSAMALYAALMESGIMNPKKIEEFQQNGSLLAELAIMNEDWGIECSGGSLGLGLSMGVGLALAAKRKGNPYKTYVMTGDGEMNEGSVWEAIMLAGQLKLDNLILIIDRNGYQSDGANAEIIDMKNLENQVESFGWETCCIDGHNYEEIYRCLSCQREGKPYAVIADTIKGKGISFMESDNEWHHKILNCKFLDIARQETGV